MRYYMNKKKFIVLICILILVVGGLIALLVTKGINDKKNQDSEELKAAKRLFDLDLADDKSEYIINNLKSAGNFDGAAIVIPDTIDGIPVTKIVDRELGFSKFNKIAKITIGKNITYIGTSRATSIDENKKYGEDIFLGATKLMAIDVHSENKVYSSVDGVLYNKDKSILIKYPNGRTKKENQAIHTYIMNDDVVKIYTNAFRNNKSLESITLSSNLIEIGDGAFYGCDMLSTVKFNDKLTKIGKNAFNRCKNISNINLPNSLLFIGFSAFNNCTILDTVVMSDNIEIIEANVFTACPELSSIFISKEKVEVLKNILLSKNENVVSLIKEKVNS